jgi:hypothetical protein
LYIKKPVNGSYEVNGVRLNALEEYRLNWIANWTVTNFAMPRYDAIAYYIAKGAFWGLTQGFLALDNPWNYSNCDGDQIGALETCHEAYPWRVGISATEVAPHAAEDLEARGIQAYSFHFGYEVDGYLVLVRSALQAGYNESSSEFNGIVNSSGELRKAWPLKPHLVGFYYTAQEVDARCFVEPVDNICLGNYTRDAASIEKGVDSVSILIQSVIGAFGRYVGM